MLDKKSLQPQYIEGFDKQLNIEPHKEREVCTDQLLHRQLTSELRRVWRKKIRHPWRGRQDQ